MFLGPAQSILVRLIGPDQSQAASTLLLSCRKSPTVPSSPATPPEVAASEARCPPDENPEAAMNEVSNPYLAAFPRMNRITALMSSIWAGNFASELERWFGVTTA